MTKERPYAFRELFGDTTRIRVIEALTDGIAMTTTDWAEEAGVNIKYVYKHLPLLRMYNLVKAEKNPENPREKLYRLDFSNPAARQLQSAVMSFVFIQLGVDIQEPAKDEKADAAQGVRTLPASSASAPAHAARRVRRSR